MLIHVAGLDGIMFTWFNSSIARMKEYLMENEDFLITPGADISPVLNLEYAYNPNPLRAVFFSANSNCTVMIPNLQDGWHSLVYTIAANTKCDAYFIQMMDDKKLREPVNHLSFFKDGIECRIVYALKENKWVFYEQGQPMSFECTDNYKQAVRKKRINKELLLKYCTELGMIKGGYLLIDEACCFTLESYWKGEGYGLPGAGDTCLKRK